VRKKLGGILAAALFFSGLSASPGGAAEPVFVGTTFSHRQSGYLDMDWKQSYLEILKLNFYSIRLGAYWDEIERVEGVYDFSTLDWQMAEAARRKIPVVLTVGMKAPRWPEFFIPDWLEKKIRVRIGGDVSRDPLLRDRTLRFVEAVVKRYREKAVVRYWQVENEALDRSGPRFWRIGADFLAEEIALVKRLDPASRPVILTAATYPNTVLFFLARFQLGGNPIVDNLALCDILGINVYPVVGQMFWRFKIYFWSSPEERTDYFSRLMRLARRAKKDIWIMELQAEPWEPGLLVHKTREQPPTGLPENVRKSFEELRTIGYHAIFLWGAEYWYYRSLHHEDRRWWQMVSELVKDRIQSGRATA